MPTECSPLILRSAPSPLLLLYPPIFSPLPRLSLSFIFTSGRMQLPLYHVDAFASAVFRGNPAAVVPVADFPPDPVMQVIAAENNLSETAFIRRTSPAAKAPKPYCARYIERVFGIGWRQMPRGEIAVRVFPHFSAFFPHFSRIFSKILEWPPKYID